MHCQTECILNDLELVKITESDTLGRKKNDGEENKDGNMIIKRYC